MPAGKTAAPRAIPFHLAHFTRGRKLPQREISRIAFLTDFDPFARFQAFDVEPRKMTIVGLPARVEVDPVRGSIRVTVLLEIDDERDLIGDVIGRATENRRTFDVQQVEIREECIGVERGDLPCRLAGAPRALLHLVFARVGVGDEMAHVGHVHHVRHAITVPFEHASQRVLEQKRPVVADMLIVVDGGTARVHADAIALADRLESA